MSAMIVYSAASRQPATEIAFFLGGMYLHLHLNYISLIADPPDSRPMELTIMPSESTTIRSAYFRQLWDEIFKLVE